MSKIFGAMLVLLGCCMLGYAPVYRTKMRIKHLQAYMDMLGRMKQKLSVQQLSLPQLFLYLNDSAKLTAKELCEAVHRTLTSDNPLEYTNIWSEMISNQSAMLNANEQDALSTIGESLGKCSIEEQVYIISQAEHILGEAYDDTYSRYNQMHRLYPSCSLAIGLMVVVVLI